MITPYLSFYFTHLFYYIRNASDFNVFFPKSYYIFITKYFLIFSMQHSVQNVCQWNHGIACLLLRVSIGTHFNQKYFSLKCILYRYPFK